MFRLPPMPQGHYVYLHVRLDTNAVFYVGKGSKYRAWIRTKRSPRHIRTIEKMEREGHGWEIRIIREGMTCEEAFELEMRNIAFYGRENLVNLSDGGDGNRGYKATAETRAKMSAAQKGKKMPPEGVEKSRISRTGKKRTPEQCARISAAVKGKKHTPEQNAAKSARQKGFKLSKVQLEAMLAATSMRIRCVETGVEFRSQAEAAGAMGLKRECVRDVIAGKQRTTAGYRFERVQ